MTTLPELGPGVAQGGWGSCAAAAQYPVPAPAASPPLGGAALTPGEPAGPGPGPRPGAANSPRHGRALPPPPPRARVTVTKHSAPPCHNKSPEAPAAGDPLPSAGLRGHHPRRARGLGGGGRALPLPHTPRARPHARPRAAPGAGSPPHPARALAHLRPTPPGVSVGATRPIRAAGPPRAVLPGGAEWDRAGGGRWPRVGAAVLRGPGLHAWEEREGGNGRRARRGGSSPSCRCRAEGAGRGAGRP